MSGLPFSSPLSVDEIYAKSFAEIRACTGIAGDSLVDRVKLRMVHACGDPDIIDDIVVRGTLARAMESLRSGCSIFTDSSLCRSAIMDRFLPKGCEVVCGLDLVSDEIVEGARFPTRSALGVEAFADRLGGSIVVIGNAPTALERLLLGLGEEGREGWELPSLIIGVPVGFVGAVESKAILEQYGDLYEGLDYITLRGRKGGSAIAASALNALLLHLHAGD